MKNELRFWRHCGAKLHLHTITAIKLSMYGEDSHYGALLLLSESLEDFIESPIKLLLMTIYSLILMTRTTVLRTLHLFNILREIFSNMPDSYLTSLIAPIPKRVEIVRKNR